MTPVAHFGSHPHHLLSSRGQRYTDKYCSDIAII